MEGPLVGILLVLAAAALVLYPVLRAAHDSMADAAPMPEEEADPLARRQAIYMELLDLDFDHRVGKVSDEDYLQLREAMVRRAADLLRMAEEDRRAADEQIEAEVSALRRSSGTAPPAAVHKQGEDRP